MYSIIQPMATASRPATYSLRQCLGVRVVQLDPVGQGDLRTDNTSNKNLNKLVQPTNGRAVTV